jgi:hypothetical protein
MALTQDEKALRKARRDYEKKLASLKPIADQVKVIDGAKEEIEVELFGAKVTGYVNHVNAVIESCGFRPVRLTSNLLNRDSKVWAIDINTPSYMDPGSEAYHSM